MNNNKVNFRIFAIIIFCLSVRMMCYAQSYTIDASIKHQTMANFGASDAWTVQFMGLWPDEKRNGMADLLFSMETDASGKPKGIGLSLWRFYIGAGSAFQGTNSYIADEWKRTECFQNLDGTYDWTKQEGQRWFLKAAKERGVEQFLAFCKSPPIQMTMNGLASSKFRPADGTYNIKPDKYGDFADFMATVVVEIEKRDGIKFQYLSPFNEPDINWNEDSSQEGTTALMSEIAKTVRLLNEQLEQRQLNTKIIVPECGIYDNMYKRNTDRPGRDEQIETLFNPASEHYIGNEKHVPQLIVGHSYWTTEPADTLLKKRQELRNALKKQNLDFWHTEYCLLGAPEVGGIEGRDLGMTSALYAARVIHYDICVANAAAWQWWRGISKDDRKNGLVYCTVDDDKKDGTFTDSKLLWALGNYSRFVRPGAVRLDIQSKNDTNDPEGLMISSYIHHADQQLVTVIINYSNEKKVIDLKTKNVSVKDFTPYVTSDREGDNLAPLPKVKYGSKITIPERSVVTLIANNIK